MAQIYDRSDLAWTSRGDFIISHNGDIMDTSADPLRSLFQEVRTRIMADLGDWKLYPQVGASLADFVGEPNNRQIAESIKTRIKAALSRDGLVNSGDIQVRYAPIDSDRLMIRVTISVAQTAANAGSESLRISVVYDYSENNVYVAAGRA